VFREQRDPPQKLEFEESQAGQTVSNEQQIFCGPLLPLWKTRCWAEAIIELLKLIRPGVLHQLNPEWGLA
jgi:hypothetical protein